MKRQYKILMTIIMGIMTQNTISMNRQQINHSHHIAETDQIINKAKEFSSLYLNGTWPTSENSLIEIKPHIEQYVFNNLINDAKNTRLIIDPSVITLCNNFITLKKEEGTPIEKEVYADMTVENFIVRCIEKRPLVFYEKNDISLLREQDSSTESRDFTKIGTKQEKNPLVLAEYLSYDEMKIAALLGLSSPTQFINNGARNNRGLTQNLGTFQEHGVYVGLVGARFERPGLMEWQDIIITPEQNTTENGYGLEKCKKGLVKLWADFYGTTCPTYEEAQQIVQREASDTSLTSQSYFVTQDKKKKEFIFNIKVYKKRIASVVKPFLLEANQRGLDANRKVYVHVVGLGLGVWEIHHLQKKLMLEVYEEIIRNNVLSEISDINFSWFGDITSFNSDMQNGVKYKDKEGNRIGIHFSKRNPADKLQGNNADKILVAMYAWDGNAYPGNEYWQGLLDASGDPAAACCSFISVLQNILINPWLKENIREKIKMMELEKLEHRREVVAINSQFRLAKKNINSQKNIPGKTTSVLSTVFPTVNPSSHVTSTSTNITQVLPMETQSVPMQTTPSVTPSKRTPSIPTVPVVIKSPTPLPESSYLLQIVSSTWSTITGFFSYLRSWLPW